MRVEIVPATTRDVSFIVANLCEDDRREIACQLPPGAPADAIVPACFLGEAWVALLDGQPVEAFGAVPTTGAGNVLNAWAFGTRRRARAIPAVTRFLRGRVEAWIATGVTRVEARSIAGHAEAHRWLRALGADEAPLPAWGRDGEDFIMFSWTAKRWVSVVAVVA